MGRVNRSPFGRIGLVIVVLAATALAEPLTYKLVAQTGDEGTTPVGTITIADGYTGQATYDIATPGTAYDLYVPGGPLGTAWNSSAAERMQVGTMAFATGEVIGDSILHPAIPTPGDSTIYWTFWTPNSLFPDYRPGDPSALSGWLTLQTLSPGSWDPDRNFWQWVLQAPPHANDQYTTHGPETAWYLERVDPVPEPSTWAMLAIGGLGLAWIRRRRRAK